MSVRPNVRRKPSASNLFSSIGRQGGSGIRDHDSEYSFNPSVAQESTTPSTRMPPNNATTNGITLSVTGPDSFSAIVEKRTASWWYLRRAHDTNELWFHTIMITRTNIAMYLDSTLGEAKVQQRSRNLLLLGLSLSPLFDMTSASDLLKALIRLLDEWEVWSEGGGGKGMKNLFRGQKSNKKNVNVGEFAGGYQDGNETSLTIINVPFTPDYFQTVISVCEIVRQIYIKLGNILLPPSPTDSMPNDPIPSPNWPQPPSATYRDPSGFSNRRGSENNLVHPGGAPSSHGHPPKSASAITASMVSGSDIPRAASYAGAGSFPRVFSNTGPTRPGVGWSPQLCELIMKADGKLKKIMLIFTREMEAIARTAVQTELTALLPGASAQSFRMET